MRLVWFRSPIGVGLATKDLAVCRFPRKNFRDTFKTTHISSVQRRRYSSGVSALTIQMSSQQPNSLQQPAGMEDIAARLEQFMQVPTASKVWFQGGAFQTVTVQYNQRNLAANKMRKYLETYALGAGGAAEATPSLPIELRDTVLFAPSPSGKLSLVARGGSEGTSAVLEVWGQGRLLRELHVPSKQHGPLYNDGWFSLGPAWSPDESRIAYVAEEPSATETPKWCGAATADLQEAKDVPPTAAPKSWQGIGEHQEDWGELNTGKKTPALFVLDTTTWQVSRIGNLPADHSVGQPVWSPEGDKLVFTAWPHSPPNAPQFGNRLGIVYCMNRPCSLFAVPVASSSGSQPSSGEAVLLTPGQLSACSPRFLPDGSKLVFLSNEPAAQTMTHMGTAELLTLDWPESLQGQGDRSTHTLVPVVQSSGLEEFPGLYPHALSESCFAGGSDFVLLTSQWRSRMALLAVDLKTGRVQDIGSSNQSWSLLGAGHGWVAAAASSPTQPPRLMLARIPSATTASESQSWKWTSLGPMGHTTTPDAVQSTLDSLQWQTYQVEAATEPRGMPFEAVVVRPKEKTALPGVLFPHGGPHSAYPAAYSNLVAFQAAQGYAVIAVNFRGSTGFGEDSIQSLPGHISVNDVEDCIAALDHAVAEGIVDRDRVAVSGGSHGGFLTGNLLGRHADRFKAGLTRNPVMDLSLMIHVSDIPDWCYVEAYGVQEAKKRMAARPTIDDLTRFKEVSPISVLHQVKAPVLLLLGAKDRRVPLADGQQYAAALRAQGGIVKTIVFPEDTHALDRPQTEFETMINMISWLQQHV